jgi:hypothetical protein
MWKESKLTWFPGVTCGWCDDEQQQQQQRKKAPKLRDNREAEDKEWSLRSLRERSILAAVGGRWQATEHGEVSAWQAVPKQPERERQMTNSLQRNQPLVAPSSNLQLTRKLKTEIAENYNAIENSTWLRRTGSVRLG